MTHPIKKRMRVRQSSMRNKSNEIIVPAANGAAAAHQKETASELPIQSEIRNESNAANERLGPNEFFSDKLQRGGLAANPIGRLALVFSACWLHGSGFGAR
jgi:hypothetical protein